MQGSSEIGLNPCKMIGKTDKSPQLLIFQVPIIQFINKEHELYQLSERVNWYEIERYHRTMKNVIKLENYFFPDELRAKLAEVVDYYNNQRYHEALGKVTPADVYFGLAKQIKIQRQEIKMKTSKERRQTNIRKSA